MQHPDRRKTKVRPDFLVFGKPDIGEEDIAEVVATLRSGWLGTGPRVHRFEQEFKKYIGCQHALALSSCTAGLHLALDVLRVGVGDEVITSPITFAATANVIVHRGAKPVFVDIDRHTMNIDPEQIERAITPSSRAIIPVHLAGRPCEMDRIMAIAHCYGLHVVEDAAHATEACYGQKKIGNIGDITAFSFYVTKNLVTGEGGMVTTNNAAWAEELQIKSLHGISKDAWKRYSAEGYQPYETLYPGYKYNMSDIQAALGIHQLAKLEKRLEVRERLWHRYDAGLGDIPELTLPLRQPGIRHARHLYTILLDIDRLDIDRDRFVTELKMRNIGSGIHFVALHLHRYYREVWGYRTGDFPAAEFISARTLSLPLSAALTDEDIDDVINAIKQIVAQYRKHKTYSASTGL